MKERIFTTKEQGRVLVEAGLPISTAIGFRDKYLDQLHSMEDDAGRIGLIEAKCELEGINVSIVEESYTSKCSFLDNKKPVKHDSYKGNRSKRGLFRTGSGAIINADINGAFNIIRKSKESFDVTTLPEGRGFWWNPVRISV